MLSFSKYENFKNDKTDEEIYKEEQEPTTNPNKQNNKLDNMGSATEFGGETQDFKKENKMYGGRKKNKKKGGQPAGLTPLNDENIRLATNLWFSDVEQCIEQYGHISDWNTRNITDMSFLFEEKRDFNEDISNWNTRNVTNMTAMFNWASSFNQPIGAWNTHNVTDMKYMFMYAADFNQPIDAWDTRKVTNMHGMFYRALSFNQPIGAWDTRKVTIMDVMFGEAISFNQPIGAWNTRKVTSMQGMFMHANQFNQPIGEWDTRNVTNMRAMFFEVSNFNQPIGTWDTRNVTTMQSMFEGATEFNQDLRSWTINGQNDIAAYAGVIMHDHQALINWMFNRSNMEYTNLPLIGQTIRNQIGQEKRENFDLAHSISRDQVADDDTGFIPNYQGPVAHNKMIKAVKKRENQLKALDIMNTIMKAEDHTNPDAGPYNLLGGKGRRSNTKKKRSSYKKRKTKRNVVLLPKLRKIDDSKKKYKYKLSNPSILRKKAINEGIRSEVKKTNKTKKQAAVAKKGRFNILRIYRRNKNKNQCKIITRDMRYIDKKYGLNKTNSICGGKRNKTKKIYN